jgi:hypothetical protein
MTPDSRTRYITVWLYCASAIAVAAALWGMR